MMAATRVINRYDHPLHVPFGGPVLQPGVWVELHNWETVKEDLMVKGWLRENWLEIEAPASFPPAPQG